MESNNKPHFYCLRLVGDPDFSIDEWNKAYRLCADMGVSEKEKSFILNGSPDPCESQCFRCLAIVGERRDKTKKL